MALLDAYRADRKKMREGTVLAWPADAAEPIRFRIVFWDVGFSDAIQSLPPQERARVQNRELSSTELLDLYRRAVGEEIIVGWENMEEAIRGADGQFEYDGEGALRTRPVEYTPERALEIMRDPDFEELHEAIVQAAKDHTRYRQDVARRVLGN